MDRHLPGQKRTALTLMLLCAWLLPASAQVQFEARIDSLELLIGEQTGITLDLTCGKGQKAALPQLKAGDELMPNVEIISASTPDTSLLNEGKRVEVTQRIMVAAWDSSLYCLPPFEATVDGKAYRTKSLALKVLPVEPLDTAHLDKFYPPYTYMEPEFSWADWRPAICCSFLCVLLLAMAYTLYDRARKGKPIVRIIRRKKRLPPHQVAMEEIERIKGNRDLAGGDSKEYYTQLTDTLRTYIQSRYGFNAMEMTSAEIIDRLVRENDEESLRELREIFNTADLVKFAKYTTLVNENDANLMAAVEYINQTKQEADPNAKPEPEVIRETDTRRMNQARAMQTASVLLLALALALVAYAVWRVAGLLT
ncbi:MAG TPA: hypothetical protein DC006_00670 [Prevotellaceae bacterium]|nr:hypothetical protein [Prevotellaceae bacterium]